MNFNITSSAKEKLLNLKEKNEPIKVKITGHTWCGAQLGIVSEKQYENDEIHNIDSMEIIVSEDIKGAVKGLKIDYKEGFFRKGFEVEPLFK